jgi:capsular polysaccharide biosynthesis protein
MSLFNQIARPFFWRPGGYVPSLESLDVSPGVLAKSDVTVAVGGMNEDAHRLIVVELAKGKVLGSLRLAITCDDVVIGGLQNLAGCSDPMNNSALRRRNFRLPRRHRGTALLLGAHGRSDNYYHWVIESLPRWKILQAAKYLDYDFVLLQSQATRFEDEFLDRLGVPPARRFRCSKNFTHQFERLVVPAMPFPGIEIAPWVCAWVRSLFPAKNSGPEKIFISRRGAQRRRLINEAALEKQLQALGFVSLQLEQLPIAEQAGLFGSAKCVVAAHGAGLTNLIFTPANALLVELFHPENKSRIFANLAAACGHRYLRLEGCAANQPSGRHLEYTIDVAAVVQTIS